MIRLFLNLSRKFCAESTLQVNIDSLNILHFSCWRGNILVKWFQDRFKDSKMCLTRKGCLVPAAQHLGSFVLLCFSTDIFSQVNVVRKEEAIIKVVHKKSRGCDWIRGRPHKNNQTNNYFFLLFVKTKQICGSMGFSMSWQNLFSPRKVTCFDQNQWV